MKLNVVLSDNFLDANFAQIDLIGNGLREGKKQFVLVPDKDITNQEKLIMDRLKLGATFGIKVMSISMLADMILEGKIQGEPLSKIGAVLIIEELISELKSRLICFEKTLVTVSFAESVYRAIMQFKMCGISPQMLRNTLTSLPNDFFGKKIQDLCLIYDAYESYKANNFYDEYDRLNVLAQEISCGDFTQNDFHFCNFASMSQVEFGVLSSLAKTADSVSVGVMVGEDGQPNADLIVSDVLDKINEFCAKTGQKPSILRAKSERAEFTLHMLRNALAVVPQQMEINGQVEIYEASNPRIEVEFVATDILQRVRRGARFCDFEINCANLVEYEPLIRNIFDAKGIPFWLDTSTAIEVTELGKFVFSAVDFAYDGLQAKDLYRFVGNELSNFTQNERELFESVATCYGITGERLISPPKLQNADAKYEKYLILNQKLAPLYEFCKVASSPASVAEYSQALKNLLEQYEVAQNLSGLAQALKEDGFTTQSSVARQSYKKFDKILTTLCEFSGDVRCAFSEFNKILRSGVSGVSIKPLPESVDCVRIGQNGASAFDEARYYYIMCAIEGGVPSASSDTELVTDSDIEKLSQLGLKISPTVQERNSLSRQKVINNLCYAKERICLTYPIILANEGCSPAGVVTSITKMFTHKGNKLNAININYFFDIDLNPAVREYIIDQKYGTLGSVLKDYIEGASGVEMSAERKALQNSLRGVLEKFAPEMLSKVGKWRQKPHKIPNLTEPSQVFFTEDKAGVTQIEKFFDCPYAHFLAYGLKIKERKTATMQATDIGTLLHAVLEAFGRKLAREDVQKIEDIPPFVNAVFDKLLTRPDFENLAVSEANKAQLSALRIEAVRACEAINYQMKHSRYKIKFVEAKFGTDGFVPVPEIAIINTNKRVKISGKIDRADVCDNKLRIIDYKTSKNSAEFKLLNLYLGKKIQLFYYMAVMLKTLKYQPSGAYYLPVHKEYTEGEVMSPYSSFCMQGVVLNNSADLLCQDDQLGFEHHKSDITGATISKSKDAKKLSEFILQSNGADELHFALMLEYAEAVLDGAVQDIYNGYIEPSHFEKSCEYCKFNNICRIGVTVEDKVRTDKFDVKGTAVFASKTNKEQDE